MHNKKNNYKLTHAPMHVVDAFIIAESRHSTKYNKRQDIKRLNIS